MVMEVRAIWNTQALTVLPLLNKSNITCKLLPLPQWHRTCDYLLPPCGLMLKSVALNRKPGKNTQWNSQIQVRIYFKLEGQEKNFFYMNVKAIITLKLTYAKMTIVFPKKGRNL